MGNLRGAQTTSKPSRGGSADDFAAAGFTGAADELISLLQFTQASEGCISPRSARLIARFLRLPEAQVFAVASFYTQFRFHPPGQTHVRVCLGTACHVQGGSDLARAARELLQEVRFIRYAPQLGDYGDKIREVAARAAEVVRRWA